MALRDPLQTFATFSLWVPYDKNLRDGYWLDTKMHPAAVIIVGTSHSIHIASRKLMPFLERLCRNFAVSAVAEEMSEDALLESNCTASIPMQMANALRLPHRFCDPNTAERARLGIRQQNDILISAFLGNLSETEVAVRLADSHAKCESYWLAQLRDLNLWPVLFVCGANHVDTFFNLLRHEDIAVRVAVEDSGPLSEKRFACCATKNHLLHVRIAGAHK